MRSAPEPTADWLRHVCASAQVPVWLPWPLPHGWFVSSVTPVGDDVSGVRAVAVTLGGPHPLGGFAEMMLLGEETGVGLGSRLAGIPASDPVVDADEPPYARVQADGHPVPMWLVDSAAPCAVVVGERDLRWLWLFVRPAQAGTLLLDPLALTDAREIGEEVRLLPYGVRSDWLDA
jgi:hypothetical protein